MGLYSSRVDWQSNDRYVEKNPSIKLHLYQRIRQDGCQFLRVYLRPSPDPRREGIMQNSNVCTSLTSQSLSTYFVVGFKLLVLVTCLIYAIQRPGMLSEGLMIHNTIVSKESATTRHQSGCLSSTCDLIF